MEDLTGDSPTIASKLTGVAAVVAGRYRVRARLGRGATKEVYLAYDERLDRDVALAIVVGAATGTARARVAREAQVTGRLGDHPNVITVYDTGEHDGLPYLVLRAMPGGSLANLLDRARLSFSRAAELGGQIAAALAHAHAHDVVHRDVKPDNVWLAGDGSAALGDFGIAHLLGSQRLTAEGVVVGTVRYLSPEQIRGEDVGPATDLYALGVTLYELVTGQTPFTAKDATQVLTQHLTAIPVPPSRLEPEIPPELEELILALLAKDAGLRPPSARDVASLLARTASSLPAPTTPVLRGAPATRRLVSRRIVSVLAARADVADPEALHGVFDRCAAVIEQHGGTVERYLGDALVGFFGLDESHGDDALRATRAAVQLRSETAELRLGIESGEVFLGSGPRGAAVATGATITTAGHLAEGAGEGEILLGEEIRHIVAGEARIDPASGRLLELQVEQPALLRTPSTPFVGRAQELSELRAALDRVREERRCHMLTVAGPPGIGKSRLAHEFLTALGDEATVLTGRCAAYGQGMTYRALADLVRSLGGDPRERIGDLLAGDAQALRAILSAVGLSDEPVQLEETAWALRRLLEQLACDRPVVVAVEDIHWAEPPLLDLLDLVVTLSGGAPILLICLTRPELLETHPGFVVPERNRSLLMLDALGEQDARALATLLGADELATRIAERAEGNPLFVEHLVAVDAGQDRAELPVSIQAVLAARIDRLDASERTILQHACVEGRTFHASALVAVLAPEQRGDLAARLVGLARKGLIGADRPEFAGEDAFRFTHALIRDAAYAGVPKLERARVHAAIGEWLEARADAADEIVAFHLEQACLLARGLGRSGQPEQVLAARAVQRLRAASRSALGRGDPAAASAQLERGVALLAPGDPAGLALLPDLGASFFQAGRMADATRVLDDAIARSTDRGVQARAQVEREFVRLETDTRAGTEQPLRVADAVLPLLRDEDDDHGSSRALSLRAQVAWTTGQIRRADEAWRAAGRFARAARDEREYFDIIAWRATAAMLGPTPVDEAIARCEGFRETVRASPAAVVWTYNSLAVLHAMRDELELAEEQLRAAAATLEQLGGLRSSVSHHEAHVRLIAGQYELAEVPLRLGMQRLAPLTDGDLLATTTAMLAQAVFAQGRTQEAAELCRAGAAGAAADDIVTQVIWRGVEAKILAGTGRCDEAIALAREAVTLVNETDLLSHHADAMLDLADVLRTCSQDDDADDALQVSLALYDRKGHVTGARRARSAGAG